MSSHRERIELFKQLLDHTGEIELRRGAFIPTERSWQMALELLEENPEIEMITLLGEYATDLLNQMVALAKGYKYENGISYQPARLKLSWKENQKKWKYFSVQGNLD